MEILPNAVAFGELSYIHIWNWIITPALNICTYCTKYQGHDVIAWRVKK